MLLSSVKGPGKVANILEAILKLKSLQRLDVSNNQFRQFGMEAMGACVSQLPHLQSLDINGCSLNEDYEMTEEASIEVAKYVLRCQGLRTLCCAGAIRDVELLQGLSDCPFLDHLELSQFKPDVFSHGGVAQNLSNLSDLQLLNVTKVSERD